tara:strand:+ start:29 stop:406 length:378 start_codon:yes stop_codon:yes gene_type:complete
MKKSIKCLGLLTLLLLLSNCSWKPEKEIVTVEKIIKPTIAVVPRPSPIKMKNTEIIVITEKNLKVVMEKLKKEQGDFVVYAMNPTSFKSLALNFEQLKKFIEQQKEIILYYEKSVTEDSQKSDKK